MVFIRCIFSLEARTSQTPAITAVRTAAAAAAAVASRPRRRRHNNVVSGRRLGARVG